MDPWHRVPELVWFFPLVRYLYPGRLNELKSECAEQRRSFQRDIGDGEEVGELCQDSEQEVEEEKQKMGG